MALDDDSVFKALADPTRRLLLDRLLVRDGRTLKQLESELEMTRFGVMKHLRVLEEARLVVSRRSGREKLHFLNPVPIRLIHDRWIDKYTESHVSALADLKAVLEGDDVARASRVFRVYIKATPQTVWDAITSTQWRLRQSALHGPGEGEVLQADPPHRLVQRCPRQSASSSGAEPPTTITWEIEVAASGVARLTVIRDLTGAAAAADAAGLASRDEQDDGDRWPYILSDLKSLLETGAPLQSGPSVSSEG